MFTVFLALILNSAFASDVLYIGDSHSVITSVNPESERLGHRLINYYRENGQSVAYYASCGSRPRHWVLSGPSNMCGNTIYSSSEGFNNTPSALSRLPNLSNLVTQNNPKTVVVNLGDNMFQFNRVNGLNVAKAPRDDGSTAPTRSQVVKEIKDLIALIPTGRECIWVGPTYHSPSTSSYSKSNAEVDLMYSIISEALGDKCQLIDSRPVFNSTRPNDGLHLVDSESRTWGDAIVNKISLLRSASASGSVALPILDSPVQQTPVKKPRGSIIIDAPIGGTE